MAKPPPGLDIVIVKPTNYATIVAKSQNGPQPYTIPDLEAMYRKGLAANCAVFISFITPELWED